ncbi:MAG: hypothetical protein ACOC2H_01835 [Spirochaetota bacterium]
MIYYYFYDINDYKFKTKLTSERLFTTVIFSLRSYHDLVTIDRNKDGHVMIIKAFANIFDNLDDILKSKKCLEDET